MDEDDDAFLYGDGGGGEAVAQAADAVPEHGEERSANVSEEQLKSAEGGEEEDDEEEEEEDSDSDLEIVLDTSTADASRPPPGHNQRPLQTFNKTLQAQQQQQRTQAQQAAAISSEYTPLTRPGQQPANGATGETKPLAAQTNMTAAQAYALQQQQQLAQLPEGPPPPVPSTAPRLDLDPADQALILPPDTVGGEPGPLIYHVDPTEMEEKPWRRPGADITDWFNYGFNEESWHIWGAKKTSVNAERIKLEQEGASVPHGDNYLHDQQQQQMNSSMPMQFMQAMVAASGMSMPPDQMMSFMGLNNSGGGNFGGPMMGMGGMMPFMGGMGGGGGSMPPLMRMGQSGQANGQGGMRDESSAGGFMGGGEQGQKAMQPSATLPIGVAKERSRSPLPPNLPTGPKNANTKRYNDRDTGAGQADALDYGANAAAAAAAAANGRDHDDEHRRRRSTSTQGQRYSPAPAHVHGRSTGWEQDSPRRSGSASRRSQSPPSRSGGGRDRGDRGSRRYASHRGESVTESREGSLTPRAARHHHDDDAAVADGRHDDDADGRRRRTTSSNSNAAGSKRTSRRRDDDDAASSVAEGAEDDSRSSSRRGHARSERRAGRETRDEPESRGAASTTSSRRSRKRAADEVSEQVHDPPREPRRRR